MRKLITSNLKTVVLLELVGSWEGNENGNCTNLILINKKIKIIHKSILHHLEYTCLQSENYICT